jgi:hypothetical protein
MFATSSWRLSLALLLAGASIHLFWVDSSAAAPSTSSRKYRPRSTVSASRTTAGCSSCTAATSAKKRAAKIKRSKAVACHPKGYVDPRVAPNLSRAMRSMRRSGISPRITSAWRSSDKQAQLHRCSQSTRCRRANPALYGALPPGRSLHEAGFAVDIAGVAAGRRGAKRLTPRGRRIVQAMQRNGFKWRYGLADPAHFEVDPRKYGYRTVSQAIRRSQTTCQVRLASTSRSRTASRRRSA